MTATAKRVRALVITVIAIAATNYAVTFASGIPTFPDAPRPKSGIPTFPDAPRPKSGIPTFPDAPRP